MSHPIRSMIATPPRARTRSVALVAVLLSLLLAAVFGGAALAQDEPAAPPPPADGAPAAGDDAAEPAKPIVGNVGVVGDSASQATDPADQVVLHIAAMTRIVRDQIDEPEKVKQQLKAYIDENGKAMKEAGDRFEARLNELAPDERQAYKEKLQRKMESALAEFLETMLDFSERHPAAAKELDEMLQAVQ